MSVERIDAAGITELGEGPHWDIKSQSLYYVDIFGMAIHKYTPATKTHTKADVGKHVSLIVPLENADNKFIISLEREITEISWDGINDVITSFKMIGDVDDDDCVKDNRINDGKCDPVGRLWFGTMGSEPVNGQIARNKGSFFSLHTNKSIKKQFDGVDCSNGLTWNADHTLMYYIDTLKMTVDQFDYDVETGNICNRKPIFSFIKNKIDGLPDGMTIDTDGNLWIACFNGYQVIKIDPRKPETLLQTIKLPARQVTSLAFGGPTLEDLYVTTAKFTIDGNVLNPPEHGALYKITGHGVKGLPATDAKM